MAGYNEYNLQNNSATFAMKASNSNRVYINPNFSQTSTINHGAVHNNGVMYVNPKFSQLAQNCDKKHAINKTKIFINPNFIRSNNSLDNNQTQITMNIKKQKGIIVNDIENITNFILPSQINNSQIVCSPKSTINKSRYSLVRPVENKLKDVSLSEKVTNTIKISKYKSIPLSDIKDSLSVKSCNIAKHTFNQTRTDPLKNENCTYSSVTTYENRYKLVKHQPLLLKNVSALRSPVPMNKKRKIIYRMKLKILKHSLKKNNIPCPLFKKFGKCIRNLRGNCEYLHDKKHVSICRKFLKGICHDKECLLSHDLTAKKMPTCYFYLKGMCIKEDCPYLHVKLNEKTKICTDFLKGYCEKGNECLNRHTNGPEKSLKIPSQCPNTYKKVQKRKDKTKMSTGTNPTQEHTGSNTEHRYYQDQEIAESSTDVPCEVIKPSRCKLGSLPSFIQL